MNNTPDLAPLIKSVLAIVGIAFALGQYPKLETWARVEATQAVSWKEPLPYFFANPRAKTKHTHPIHPKFSPQKEGAQ